MTVSDILLRRTLQGTTSDLVLDILVVPTGESQIFQEQDIPAIDIADAFVAADSEVLSRDTANVGQSIQAIRSQLPSPAQFDFDELIREKYVPMPGSPEIVGLAIFELARHAGVQLFAAGNPIGFAVNVSGAGMVIAILYSGTRAITSTVHRAFMLTGDYVLEAYNRKLHGVFGFGMQPSSGSQPEPSTSNGPVTLQEGTRPAYMSGSIKRATIHIPVFITNESDTAVSVLRPDVSLRSEPELSPLSLKMFRQEAESAVIHVQPHQTVDAQIQVQIVSLAPRQVINGTLELEANRAGMDPEPFSFEVALK